MDRRRISAAALRRLLCRVAAFFRSGRADTELDREITSHLRLLEDSFIAQGMSADEARFAARRAFGGQVEQMKSRQRDARSFRWLDESWLDLKLGARMAVKYPGLTVIAVVALAVAIGAGAAYLEFVTDLVRPTLPIADGHRIVAIQNWDRTAGAADERLLRDFVRWRDGLRSFDELGAYVRIERNVITDDGRAEPVRGVEISASAFRVIPATPVLGRALVSDDERNGAPLVAVIGYELWQARFGGDHGAIGRTVRIGRNTHTIVGVMPPGFGFPVNQRLWVPLGIDAATLGPGEGPSARVFGRLAPGVEPETAQAEMTAMASRAGSEGAAPDERVQPLVKPYAASIFSTSAEDKLQVIVLYSANLIFVALLGVCGANVATLVFARSAMRETEITVRMALGASRGRIVAQLFAEALVLATLAAALGLAGASHATAWGTQSFRAGAVGNAPLPFWWDHSLSKETWIYAGLLALVAAAIVGVVPALKATGQEMLGRLKYAAAGATMKFGGVWTGVIVSQIALTVIFLMSIVSIGWNLYLGGYRSAETIFPREQFLNVRIDRERDTMAPAARQAESHGLVKASYQALEERLLAEPGVGGVTYSDAYPSIARDEFLVEFESLPTASPSDEPLRVGTLSVGPRFFETLNVPILAGRGFTSADVEFGRPVAIVDQAFVQHVLGGRNPLGQRVRQSPGAERPEPGAWSEIVGVVPDLSILPHKTFQDAVLYRPLPPNVAPSLRVTVHVQGDPRSFEPRLRALAAAADPTLRLSDVMRLDEVDEADRIVFDFLLRALAVVSAVTLLLATAGVYALLSFTVTRRTREIGIRAAVGADRRRILSGIFSRAFGQVGFGIVAGSVPGSLLIAAGAPDVARGSGPSMALVASTVIALFVMTVTVLACIVPARRALRVQPIDALRADA